MLTFQELDLIRSRMEEEHRKDIEALERISRFLPENASFRVLAQTKQSGDPNAELLMHTKTSVSGTVESILYEHRDRTWTGQQIKAEMLRRGIALNSKNPLATIGVAIKKLADRGKIKIVRLGSGSDPHIYQWKDIDLSDCEVLTEEHAA